MNIDLTALLPSLLVGGIGLLIRLTFKTFGDKLDKVVTEVERMREEHGNRLTRVETRLSERLTRLEEGP